MTSKVREIRIEGNIAYVPLTKGYEAIIDAMDAPLVDHMNWIAFERPGLVYAGGRFQNRTVYLHRLIMTPPPGMVIDHIDHNPLNNRRLNLRIVTQSQNLGNARAKKSNTSGVKGVHWDRSRGKWVAAIKVNYKSVTLGRFASIQEAAKAYADASLRLRGEIAASH